MTTPGDLHVVRRPQLDDRLGRQVVHDPQSKRFLVPRAVDLPVASFRHRVFDPDPTPFQQIGCCTGCDQCIRADTAGNRVRGTVLGMADAIKFYSWASANDPWPGAYPPEDTGSSGLAAAKAAKFYGVIDRYEWIVQGVDVLLTQLRSRPVGVGTWWTDNMFNVDPESLIIGEGGAEAGGHQWSLIGWSRRFNAFEGQCWWGDDWAQRSLFRIRKQHLADLLADDGDAHVSYRAGATG